MKPAFKPSKLTRIEDHLPTEGWGPFKYQWYSVCSEHRTFDVNCSRCLAGRWVNAWEAKMENFVYDNDPDLWRWWANRPLLIPALKRLYKSYKNKNAK